MAGAGGQEECGIRSSQKKIWLPGVTTGYQELPMVAGALAVESAEERRN